MKTRDRRLRRRRRLYSINRDTVTQKKRDYDDGLKIKAIQHYSPNLQCMSPNCLVPNGCRDIDVLTLDHVNNDGAKHRRQLARTGRGVLGNGFYHYLIQTKFKTKYKLQVLCMNCQFKKRKQLIRYGRERNG